MVGFRPNLIRADGSVPPIEQIHLHHAAWVNLSRRDSNGRIVAHRQATKGDVWNETGNVAAGPDADFGAAPQLIRGPFEVGGGQKSGR